MAGEMSADVSFTFTMGASAQNVPLAIAADISSSFSMSSSGELLDVRSNIGMARAASGRRLTGTPTSGSRGSVGSAGPITA